MRGKLTMMKMKLKKKAKDAEKDNPLLEYSDLLERTSQ